MEPLRGFDRVPYGVSLLLMEPLRGSIVVPSINLIAGKEPVPDSDELPVLIFIFTLSPAISFIEIDLVKNVVALLLSNFHK